MFLILLLSTAANVHAAKRPTPTPTPNPDRFNNNGQVLLTPDNHVILNGEVTAESVDKVVSNLDRLMNNNLTEVGLFISSGGGSVLAGNRLIDQINYLQTNNVTVSCVADRAFSMAFAILQHCNNRYVMRSSIVMQHQMSTGNIGGSFRNIISYIDFMKQLNENLDTHQAERLGLSVVDFREKTEHDWWLLGHHIITENVADEVVVIGCSPGLYSINTTFTAKTLFFDVKVTLSGCPLIKTPLSITADVEVTEELKSDIMKSLTNKTFNYL